MWRRLFVLLASIYNNCILISCLDMFLCSPDGALFTWLLTLFTLSIMNGYEPNAYTLNKNNSKHTYL